MKKSHWILALVTLLLPLGFAAELKDDFYIMQLE